MQKLLEESMIHESVSEVLSDALAIVTITIVTIKN